MEHTKDTKKPLLDEEKMEYDGGDSDGITCENLVGKKWFKISMAVAVLLVGVVVISVFMRGGAESAATIAGTNEGSILSQDMVDTSTSDDATPEETAELEAAGEHLASAVEAVATDNAESAEV